VDLNNYTEEIPVIEGTTSLKGLDDLIAKPTTTNPDRKYYIALSITLSMLGFGVIGILLTFYYGIGMWGNNIPVAWAFDITNFVFWVGIGHAGTLISAILFLLRQKWRTGISRFAEGMTIFAVMTAGIFPIIHLGRPWLAGYLFPYPNQHGLWVNFTSPLVWDVFAVSTYFTVSLIFWFVGLIPDLAVLRERTVNKVKKIIYSIFSLGWRFSNRHWQHYEMVYLILAGFATPLVLSVHTIVSFDFAVSILPGWHSTIFPPYFVAGAVFSGFAMVQNILILIRKIFNYEHIITLNTLERMNKVILLTGSMVGYSYIMEMFIAWYSGIQPERFVFINRALGPYAPEFWIMVSCNVIFPQLFWFKKIRRSIKLMFTIGILVNVGMWMERFVIVVTSLSRDFLPSSWHHFTPTWVDFSILIGSFGFFLTWLLLFTKALPVVSMAEVKAIVKGSQPSHGDHLS
jgi:molybdopterin-containing oxidoreductase family membrane subunit